MRSTIRTRWLAAGIIVLAAIAVLMLRPRSEEQRTYVDSVRVERGEVSVHVDELGVLAPRDPVIAKAPFNARLQWVIEDGTWVEPGANLFILSDEDEVKRIAEMRSELVQARAELRLAKLRRQNGERIERPKLATAERALVLADLRRRLIEAKPEGGMALVRIAEELRPLAENTAVARRGAERTQDAYQQAMDAYLIRLDAWQGNRDRILRLQARLDELEAASDGQGGDGEKAQADRRRQAEEARAELESERARTAALAVAADQARAEREALQAPRDAAAQALERAEAAEADLRFRAEVEKRALPLARLQLDERQAAVDLAETRRVLEQTRAAVASGSVARSELERLVDQLARHENALEVVRTRIAIASRPPDARTLAEADAQLLQARTSAEDARSAYQRAIAMLDQELELKQAQVERLERRIDQRSAGFPTVLESGIRFAERELSLLGPDEADERVAVEAQLARLREQHAAASDAPPNIVKAPVAGLVRVQRNGDRQRQAGDQCWELDPMVEIYPPENMDVLLRVNEVDVPRLRLGQHAQVAIPALKDLRLDGEVVQIAGVGRDKFSRPEYAGKAGFADVVDFEVRVRLDRTTGVELRQGMAARVRIELSRREALRLPLAALRRAPDGGWLVRRAGGGEQAVAGAPAGPLWFALEGGLADGDEVVIERTRNR